MKKNLTIKETFDLAFKHHKKNDFKISQNNVLITSFENKNDDGIESARIPINDAIRRALSYYND